MRKQKRRYERWSNSPSKSSNVGLVTPKCVTEERKNHSKLEILFALANLVLAKRTTLAATCV
jgi:hypothetical protein